MPDLARITDSNQADMEELISTVAEIAERLKRMEAEQHRLFTAWSQGGLRGLRTAARNGSTNGRD